MNKISSKFEQSEKLHDSLHLFDHCCCFGLKNMTNFKTTIRCLQAGLPSECLFWQAKELKKIIILAREIDTSAYRLAVDFEAFQSFEMTV